jgi:hypothetical protein
LDYLLGRLTIKGLTLSKTEPQSQSQFPPQTPTQTLVIAEARIRELSLWRLTLAALSLSSWEETLATGTLELRDLRCPTGLGLLGPSSLGSLSLALGPHDPTGAADPGLLGLELKTLKLTDLRLAEPGDLAVLRLETLTAQNVSVQGLGSLVLTGLSYASDHSLEIASLTLANLAFPDLLPQLTGDSPINPLALLASARSGEAESLALRGTLEGELLTLKKGRWERPASRDEPGASRLSLAEFFLNAPALGLVPTEPVDPPPLLALWSALGERWRGSLELTLPQGGAERTGRLQLELAESGSLKVAFTSSLAFFQSLLEPQPNFWLALGSLGPGSLAYQDQGLAQRYQAALDPTTTQEIQASWRQTLQNFGERGLLAEPEALAAEVAAFLAGPHSLELAWRPPPGFPMSSTLRLTQTGPLTNLDLLNPENPQTQALAQDLAPLLINDLGLALTVNDRPPLSLIARSTPPSTPGVKP